MIQRDAQISQEDAARKRVLDALLEIQQFDTDHEFLLIARRRYMTLTAPRADNGANIVMAHIGINAGN